MPLEESKEENQTPDWGRREEAYEDFLEACFRLMEEGKMSQEDFIRQVARYIAIKDRLHYRASKRQELSKEEANTDALTGLPNKRAFDQKYSQLVSRGSSFALLIIDLNNFKPINDTYGHEAGDITLVQAGMNLQRGVRLQRESENEDFVGRYGGDEFVVLLPGVSNQEDLNKILSRLTSAFTNSPISYPVTISVGAGIHSGQSGHEKFFTEVDRAMYTAKERSKKEDNGSNFEIASSISRQLEAA